VTMWRRLILLIIAGAFTLFLAERFGPGGVQRRGLKAAERFGSQIQPIIDRDPRFAAITISVRTNMILMVEGEVSNDQALRDLQKLVQEPAGSPFRTSIHVIIAPNAATHPRDGSDASSKPADLRQSVKAEQLGDSVTVIGPLDQPLGKLIVIEGKLVPQIDRLDYWSANVANNLFGVEKVNGKALGHRAWIELVLPPSLGKLKDGYATFEGYQDGGFVNVPDDAVQVTSDFPPQSNGWHFHVVFHVIDRQHKRQ
jgi:hypothetical protein